VPANHGGFETFAEKLSLYLVERGWNVFVYCQRQGNQKQYEDNWNGVKRINISVLSEGARGTVAFDWRATRDASQHSDLCLVLGYNTAIFSALFRTKRTPNLINMDGIEWSRAKWGPAAKFWLWLNDWAGCWLGNHLIADHPCIKAHLQTRVSSNKITTIPYGADLLARVPEGPLAQFELAPNRYATVIARAEPENSILEIVSGFSEKPRGISLVILGHYLDTNEYHQAIKNIASPEVQFIGAIYDKDIVQSLRFHSLFYIHGHQVGGTNPSLVEAMGAGNAVIAHDNQFNRWVADAGAIYFSDSKSLSNCVQRLIDQQGDLKQHRLASKKRFLEVFQWNTVLKQYEDLLGRFENQTNTAKIK
jgi:glycosyltransferase involved in cell wall biosynthesis